MFDFFRFSGRSSRLSYAWGVLPLRTLYLLLVAVLLWARYGFDYEPDAPGLPRPVVLDLLLFVVSALFLVAEGPINVRRLHDLGRRGVHYWLLLIPIYGIWLQLLMFFRRGQQQSNAFGDDPKATTEWRCVLPACLVTCIVLAGCAIWTITAFGPFLKVNAVAAEGHYSNVGILDSILRFQDSDTAFPLPAQVEKALGPGFKVTHMMQAPVFARAGDRMVSSQILSFSGTQDDLVEILGKHEVRNGGVRLTDDTVILGVEVAHRLQHAYAGDKVLLRSISGEHEFRVAGIIDTSTTLDESAIISSATFTNLVTTARPIMAIASHGSKAINRLPSMFPDSRPEIVRMNWMAGQDGPRLAAERASIQMVVAFAHIVWVGAALLWLVCSSDQLCRVPHRDSPVRQVLLLNCLFLVSSFGLAAVGVLATLPVLIQLFGKMLHFLNLPPTFFWATLWGRLFVLAPLCLLATSVMALLVGRTRQMNNVTRD